MFQYIIIYFDLGKDVATKERLQIVLNGITQHFTRLRLCWDEAIVSIKFLCLIKVKCHFISDFIQMSFRIRLQATPPLNWNL